MIRNEKRGLIRTIIIIVIAIATLSWFGVDLKNFFTSPQAQANFKYIWNIISGLWTNYLAAPASYLWGIWVEYIWTPFIDFIKGSGSNK